MNQDRQIQRSDALLLASWAAAALVAGLVARMAATALAVMAAYLLTLGASGVLLGKVLHSRPSEWLRGPAPVSGWAWLVAGVATLAASFVMLSWLSPANLWGSVVEGPFYATLTVAMLQAWTVLARAIEVVLGRHRQAVPVREV